jgi:hypothetical protein
MERQSDCKIPVASLCCDSGQTRSASTKPPEQRHLHGSKLRSPPDMVRTWTQDRHLGHVNMTVTLPSLLSVKSSSLDGSGLDTQLHCIGHSDTTNGSNGTFNVIGSTDGDPTHVNETIDPYIVHTNTVQHRDGPGEPTVPISSAPSTMPGSTNATHIHRGADSRVQSMALPTPAQLRKRVLRAARPSYTEEQKFFIMYHRIVGELSWPEIEDKFVSHFGIRSGDGLTSVYYRTRKSWGMQEVLKTQSGSFSDRTMVEARANHFSREFFGKAWILRLGQYRMNAEPSAFFSASVE